MKLQLLEISEQRATEQQVIKNFDSVLCQKASKHSLEELEMRLRQEGKQRQEAVNAYFQELFQKE